MDKKKILLIDDEKTLVLLNKVLLESHGYDVVTAFDGKEGLEKVEKEKPDLIIMDIAMPVMNGYEVLNKLKNDDRFRDMPVIMLTGKTDSDSLFRAECLEAAEYLTKPFETKDLLELVKKFI